MKQRLIVSYRKLRETNIVANFINLSGIQLSNTLLLILIIPLITRVVGIRAFGLVMFASRFSQLAGTVINYGTIQSGVRDIASSINNTEKLSNAFYHTFYIRIIVFIMYLFVLLGLHRFNTLYYTYVLLAAPMVLAEVLNPLFFFIGTEKLKLFNLYNLLSNVVCIAAIWFFIKDSADAVWINFIIGLDNVILYAGLLVYIVFKFKLPYMAPLRSTLSKLGKENFYLTINNISVHLQQSIIIFALPKWGNANLLGPYSLCDRIIGQCRILSLTVSNALYPNAVHVYQQSVQQWNVYRHKTKYLITGVFFVGSIATFILADFIVFILSKEHNATAALFLRIMALVPTISALNVLNVLDQLLKNNTVAIFRIAIVLLVLSALTVFVLLHIFPYQWVGSFTLIIEICAWLMYEYLVKKTTN